MNYEPEYYVNKPFIISTISDADNGFKLQAATSM